MIEVIEDSDLGPVAHLILLSISKLHSQRGSLSDVVEIISKHSRCVMDVTMLYNTIQQELIDPQFLKEEWGLSGDGNHKTLAFTLTQKGNSELLKSSTVYNTIAAIHAA